MSLNKYSVAYFLIVFAATFGMLASSIINPFLSIYAKQIGATGVYIGLIVAAFSMVRIFLQIPCGIISSRFGYFIPMSIGMFLISMGYLFSAFITSPVQLVLARFLIGIGSPFFFTVSLTFTVNLFDTTMRGKALGLFKSIEFIGAIIASTLSGYIVTLVDFRGSFILSSLLAFVVPPHVREKSREVTSGFRLSLSSFKDIFNRNIIILCSATFAMFMMNNGIIFTIFPLYTNETLLFTLTQIGILMGFREAGFVISVVSMGALSDRIGRRPIWLFGLISGALLVVLLNYTSSFILLAFILACIGLSTGAFWVASPIIASESVETYNLHILDGVERCYYLFLPCFSLAYSELLYCHTAKENIGIICIVQLGSVSHFASIFV
jgi:MFS family permease